MFCENNQGHNDWLDFQASLCPVFKEKRVPYYGTFEITPLCNFKCNMCYIRLDSNGCKCQGGLLPADQWIDFGKQAASCGTLVLEITGGEVFTRPDFREIYEALYDMGFLIVLRSNGFLIDEHVVTWLNKRKPHRIVITLYGSSDETYMRICSVSNGFSKVTSNILNLIKSGYSVKTSMTVTRENEQDYQCVYKWTRQNNIPFSGGYSGLFKPRAETGRSIADKHVCMGAIRSEVAEAGSIVLPSGYKYEDEPFSKCKSYGMKYSLSWNGKMTICNTMSSIWENALEKGIHSAYKDMYYRMDQIHRPPKCVLCKYDAFCSNCPGMIDAETGNPEIISDAICEVAKKRCLQYANHLGKGD